MVADPGLPAINPALKGGWIKKAALPYSGNPATWSHLVFSWLIIAPRRDYYQFHLMAYNDELVKSHFSLPWWEGTKGRGKITGRRCYLFHPHPNHPPSRGREFWTFYETII